MDSSRGTAELARLGKQGRRLLRQRLAELPPQTAFATTRVFEQTETLDHQVDLFERQMGDLFEVTDEIERLMTLPGVGFILATVILGEIGDVRRFARSEQLAAYAGTTPRVHASGGRRRTGPLRSDVDRSGTSSCQHQGVEMTPTRSAEGDEPADETG